MYEYSFRNLIGKVIGMVDQFCIGKQTTLSTKWGLAFKNLQFVNVFCGFKARLQGFQVTAWYR
jgi:hypothetical protein